MVWPTASAESLWQLETRKTVIRKHSRDDVNQRTPQAHARPITIIKRTHVLLRAQAYAIPPIILCASAPSTMTIIHTNNVSECLWANGKSWHSLQSVQNDDLFTRNVSPHLSVTVVFMSRHILAPINILWRLETTSAILFQVSLQHL